MFLFVSDRFIPIFCQTRLLEKIKVSNDNVCTMEGCKTIIDSLKIRPLFLIIQNAFFEQ